MKFCINCVHCIKDVEYNRFHKCDVLKRAHTSMVTGERTTIDIYSCSSMRLDPVCGPEALLFRAIPPTPEKKKISFWKSFSMV